MDHQGTLLLIRQKSTTTTLPLFKTQKFQGLEVGHWAQQLTICCVNTLVVSTKKKPTIGETSNLKGSRRPHLWTKSWATPVHTIMFMFGCWVGVPSCDWKFFDDDVVMIVMIDELVSWWIIFSLFRCTSWKMLTRQAFCFWEGTRLFSGASC